jgi:hypothetical protein
MAEYPTAMFGRIGGETGDGDGGRIEETAQVAHRS